MFSRNLKYILLAALVAACAPGEDANEIHANVNGSTLVFQPQTAVAQIAGSQAYFAISGQFTDGDRAVALTLNLELDYATIQKLQKATGFSISGTTWFTSENTNANWFADENGSAVIQRAWVDGGCNNCSGMGSQNLNGTYEVTGLSDTHIEGRLMLAVTGIIPGWSHVNVDAYFEVAFDVPLEAAAPSSDVQDAEVKTTDPLAPTVGVEPVPVVTEVTLTKNMGVNFATGQVVPKANFANSDLWATAGHMYLKLTPGGLKSTVTEPILWWSTSGGLVKTFTGLEELPWDYPNDSHASRSLVNAKPGVGFVVRNHLSSGFTRVWIRAGNADSVIIQYELITQ